MQLIRTFPRVRRMLLLALLPFLPMHNQLAPHAAPTPPVEVQSQSFSVAAAGPSTATGVHPADILGIGGVPLIVCEDLGLVCTDLNSGTQDDIGGLSFGLDFAATDLPMLQFSVSVGARGRTGTAVRAEADCAPAQPQGDVFESALDGTNVQDLDGDGAACSSNGGYGLPLTEGATADDLDALDRDPCQSIDLNCDGKPESSLYLTLVSGSPTLALIGASPADILVVGDEFVPTLWANGVTDLGLKVGDMIDAFCLGEDGDGVYGSSDQLLFSLAPGSPSLTALRASAADLLRPAPLRISVIAAALGLETADNVDALTCSAPVPDVTLRDLYFPIISR